MSEVAAVRVWVMRDEGKKSDDVEACCGVVVGATGFPGRSPDDSRDKNECIKAGMAEINIVTL